MRKRSCAQAVCGTVTSSRARRGTASGERPRPTGEERELPPPVEAKAGRSTYACRIDIRVKTRVSTEVTFWHSAVYGSDFRRNSGEIPRNFSEFRRNCAEITTEVQKFRGIPCQRNSVDTLVKTKWDSQKEEFGASLTTLFSASRQMSAIVQSVAVEKGVPYRTVSEVIVMLGDGRREKSTKLFFLEIKAYRSAQAMKEPEPFLIAAYGVKELAPAGAAPLAV